jgi:hypothetical protein
MVPHYTLTFYLFRIYLNCPPVLLESLLQPFNGVCGLIFPIIPQGRFVKKEDEDLLREIMNMA